MTGIQDVLTVLERSGFERLPKPLTIVGTEFDFEAAARGTNSSHDLVLIATDDVPPRRLLRLVAGLARSLDLAASRRPISLVILGGVDVANRMELERYARVLPISSATPEAHEIEDAVAVLMPISLPNTSLMHGSDPVEEVLRALGPSRESPEHIALIRSAQNGPDSVRETLRRYVNAGAGWEDLMEDEIE